MAAKQSFDISTGVDIQEVDNAVNQAIKESQTRYDFKGTKCTIELDRAAFAIKLDADDEFRLKQLMGIVREKLARRQVPLKNVDEGSVEVGGLGRARQIVKLKNGKASAINTCNQWVADRLRTAGVETSLWSPFSAGLMWRYSRTDQSTERLRSALREIPAY